MKPSLFLIFILSLHVSTAFCQTLNKPNIWEKEIIAFEKRDSLQMPKVGDILFVGSSSIRGWRSLEVDYPELKTLNRGFGGAEIKDVNLFFDRIITKYKPNQIVFYAGDNDLASGKSVRQVYRELKMFYRQAKIKVPNTNILFLSIKPSLKRWNLHEEITKTNKLIKRFTKRNKYIDYIDLANPMLNENGTPRPELFIGDGLHMTPLGYDLWKTILKPYLKPSYFK